jgi:hypothetical protein
MIAIAHFDPRFLFMAAPIGKIDRWADNSDYAQRGP